MWKSETLTLSASASKRGRNTMRTQSNVKSTPLSLVAQAHCPLRVPLTNQMVAADVILPSNFSSPTSMMQNLSSISTHKSQMLVCQHTRIAHKDQNPANSVPSQLSSKANASIQRQATLSALQVKMPNNVVSSLPSSAIVKLVSGHSKTGFHSDDSPSSQKVSICEYLQT